MTPTIVRKCLLFVVAGMASTAWGQGFPGGNNGGNGFNNAGGIRIDADGLVTAATLGNRQVGLDRKRLEAVASEALPGEMNRSSPLRHVSLVRLERALSEHAGTKGTIPPEMWYLAGLQRIDHLFILPETNDVVIAGPAEGFAPDALGRAVGVSTGRPVLRIDDFAIALRGLGQNSLIGCSIDPAPQNLAALQQFLAANSSPATADVVQRRYREMARLLGEQSVSVTGVPGDSHVAAVLVEADWRMKRLALGLEAHRVRGLRSHLSMIAAGSGNSLQRWWFAPYFEGLYRTEDGLAYQWTGQRVQLLAQEELSNRGNRTGAPTTRLSTQAFAKQFTDRYDDLAAQSVVFAELQNLVDWSLVASLLRRQGLAERVGWKMEFLLDAERLDYPKNAVPRKVESLVNVRPGGNVVVGLLGGVEIAADPAGSIEAFVAPPAEITLDAARRDAMKAVAADRWWWD